MFAALIPVSAVGELYFIDYETQKRTVKDSAYHYAQLIRTNGKNL